MGEGTTQTFSPYQGTCEKKRKLIMESRKLHILRSSIGKEANKGDRSILRDRRIIGEDGVI